MKKESDFILCDKCRNYYPCPSGHDVGLASSCKEVNYTLNLTNRLIKEDKEKVMSGEKNRCKGFIKL